MESYLQDLAVKLKRVPTEDDVTSERPEMLREVDILSGIAAREALNNFEDFGG
jgi:hypothetical protein